MPEQPRNPGPPVGKLPPIPAPVAGSVTVYSKATGEPVTCPYAIDARELVGSGYYQSEPPSAEEKAAASASAEAETVEKVAAVEATPAAVAAEPLAAAAPVKKKTRKRG